jgi:DNA oxidative demethylase
LIIALGPQATLLRGFAHGDAGALCTGIQAVCSVSPLRHMITRGGWPMSVAMTNCGEVGWVSDRSGYRYDTVDAHTNKTWPPMPGVFSALAIRAAVIGGFTGFMPDACLINQYQFGARMSLHQDRDECDFSKPIVSVSLGLPAIFLWGGGTRAVRPIRTSVVHGDVVVWGGVDRLAFHGVAPLAEGAHPMTGQVRYNLTFRQAR